MRNRLRAIGILLAFPFKVDARRASVSIGVTFLAQLSGVAIAIAFRAITDAIVHHDSSGTILPFVLLLVALCGSYAGGWVGFAAVAGLLDRATLAMDTELAKLSAAAIGIEHLERPDYLDRVEYLRQYRLNLIALPTRVTSTLITLIRFGLTVGILAVVAPPLAFLPLFGIPSLVATLWRNRAMSKVWDDEVGQQFRLQGMTRRLAGTERGGREIRVFGLQDEIKRRYAQSLDESDHAWARASLRGALAQSGAWAFFGVALVGGLALVAHEAVNGHISAGDLVLVVVLAAQINSHLGSFAGTVSSVGGSMRTAERYLWLIDYAASQAPPADVSVAPSSLSEGIRFEHVSFRYPGTEVEVLHDVDVSLPAGSTVAIVGDNGAGKTTLVKLLQRMYEPTTGRIFVDGVELRELDVEEWRSRNSGAFQDFVRFEFTAQQAVGSGLLAHLDDGDAVIAALDRAHGTDVLEALPNGLRAQLGRQFSEGVELSGGQWQKLALGRTMMRANPLLLVLDEPTAALDALSEAALLERYAGAARLASRDAGGVTVLVSHRFSTVRMADLILVLEGGRITETGTHAELMAFQGLYAELFELQARSYR